MSLENLVQVSSTMWLDPAGIVGVRWMPGSDPIISERTGEVVLAGHPGYTQVIHRDNTGFMPYTCYLTSDWPIERVQSALGLVSADVLDRHLEGGGG